MTRVYERYFFGFVILCVSIALLLAEKKTIGFDVTMMLGFGSSLLFFIGANDSKSLQYVWAKRLLYAQILVFFISAYFFITWFAVVLYLFVLTIVYHLLKMFENK